MIVCSVESRAQSTGFCPRKSFGDFFPGDEIYQCTLPYAHLAEDDEVRGMTVVGGRAHHSCGIQVAVVVGSVGSFHG
jgi:hypothetical protein